MKNLPRALLVLTLLAALAACAPVPTAAPTAAPSPTLAPTAVPSANLAPTETAAPKPAEPFRVIAYVTPGIVPEVIPYQRLTHINYAFLTPDSDATFTPLMNDWKLENLVNLAHKNSVKVLISVGGWGFDKQFAASAASPDLRTAFVKNLTALVAKYNLDGVDIDWEFPTGGQQSKDYLALITELRQAMPEKLLSAAVAVNGSNADVIPSKSLPLFDYLNLMAYDDVDHGTMQQFEKGLSYWKGRSVPAEKIVMGVPFYARPGETAYKKIVQNDPAASQLDTTTQAGTELHYNGIPTIQEKTRRSIQDAGGIMFWSLNSDAPGDLSLLKAVDSVVHAK
jgi:chitinase